MHIQSSLNGFDRRANVVYCDSFFSTLLGTHGASIWTMVIKFGGLLCQKLWLNRVCTISLVVHTGWWVVHFVSLLLVLILKFIIIRVTWVDSLDWTQPIIFYFSHRRYFQVKILACCYWLLSIIICAIYAHCRLFLVIERN